jgi:hypothetical protein
MRARAELVISSSLPREMEADRPWKGNFRFNDKENKKH